MQKMNSSLSDENLAGRAARGERACFEELLVRYRDSVYRVCFRSAGNAEDAEDWAQESFVRAYQQLRLYDGARPFAPWLYRVAANVCINQARGRNRARAGLETEMDMPDEIADNASQNPEAVVLSDEARRSVLSAIDMLEPTLRQAVVLRVQEGLSFKELAETFNVPLSTASTWVRRALERVRKQLDQEGMEVGS